MKRFLIGLILTGTAMAQTTAELPRLYIEPRISSIDYSDLTPVFTREILKRCGNQVTVTTNRFHADLILAVTAGASTIKDPDGDVLGVLRTAWKTANLAKEVCAFLQGPKAAQ